MELTNPKTGTVVEVSGDLAVKFQAQGWVVVGAKPAAPKPVKAAKK